MEQLGNGKEEGSCFVLGESFALVKEVDELGQGCNGSLRVNSTVIECFCLMNRCGFVDLDQRLFLPVQSPSDIFLALRVEGLHHTRVRLHRLLCSIIKFHVEIQTNLHNIFISQLNIAQSSPRVGLCSRRPTL